MTNSSRTQYHELQIPHAATSIRSVTVDTGQVASYHFEKNIVKVTVQNGTRSTREYEYSGLVTGRDGYSHYAHSGGIRSWYGSANYYNAEMRTTRSWGDASPSQSDKWYGMFKDSDYGSDYLYSYQIGYGGGGFEVEFRAYRNRTEITNYHYKITVEYSTNRDPIINLDTSNNQILSTELYKMEVAEM